MNWTFELGTMKEIDEIERLYDSACDYLEAHTNYPGWKKGIYPTRETAKTGIDNNELFILRWKDHIAGTVILRHEPEAGYAQADWKVNIKYNDIFVVYTFVIHPDFMRQGIGYQLMQSLIDYSRKQKMKAIRLDVVTDNLPAIQLYRKSGFQYIDTVDLGYGAYGLNQFELYQLCLTD